MAERFGLIHCIQYLVLYNANGTFDFLEYLGIISNLINKIYILLFFGVRSLNPSLNLCFVNVRKKYSCLIKIKNENKSIFEKNSPFSRWDGSRDKVKTPSIGGPNSCTQKMHPNERSRKSCRWRNSRKINEIRAIAHFLLQSNVNRGFNIYFMILSDSTDKYSCTT